MESRSLPAPRSLALQAIVLAGLTGIYFISGKLGLSLAALNASASAVWPPAGLALAALLILGYRVWPAIFVGSFLVNLTTAGTVATSLAIAGGNTLEAVLAAYLASRFAGGRSAFEDAQDIGRFLFFAAIPATVLSACVGVTALAVAGFVEWQWYAPVWLTWWTGNLVSHITVTPLLLIWTVPGTWAPPGPRRLLEAGLLAAGVCIATATIFGGGLTGRAQRYPVEYLAMLPLLWAAYRFGSRGASLAVTVTGAIAIWGTLQGLGPFAVQNRNDALVLLQAFIGVASLTSLVLAAVVSAHDRDRRAMRQHEQHMAMALDSGRMGTWQWEIAAGRVAWSPRLEEIHGLAPGTFPGTFEAFLGDVHPEDRQRVQETIAQTLEQRSEHLIEYRLLLADGTIRWVEGRGRFVLDRAGRPVRLVGVCTDVTDRKVAELEREELLVREREARAEAERASAAKDQFLAVLSHELRTPLTPVLLTASLLERSSELPRQFRSDLETIRRNVELEARLIDDLLDLTKVARGKLDLELRPTDAHLLIRQAIDICYPEGRRPIALDLSATCPMVRADASRLQQVFWNLLSNAVKFTPEDGAIAIRTRDAPEDGDGASARRLLVEITDDGSGIEPELLPRLFSPFEQGQAARATRSGGLGLGLAISHALVAAHGGTLEARSDGPGRGATFTVTLPAARAEIQMPSEEIAAALASAGASTG